MSETKVGELDATLDRLLVRIEAAWARLLLRRAWGHVRGQKRRERCVVDGRQLPPGHRVTCSAECRRMRANLLGKIRSHRRTRHANLDV